mgnify:CR=1 FL=1
MRMSKFTCNHSHLFDCVTEMSTKCRKARVRISVGLREYEVRSNPYYALHQKKLQLSGNEHKVPKGTGAGLQYTPQGYIMLNMEDTHEGYMVI